MSDSFPIRIQRFSPVIPTWPRGLAGAKATAPSCGLIRWGVRGWKLEGLYNFLSTCTSTWGRDVMSSYEL